jgi:hypothetical protein
MKTIPIAFALLLFAPSAFCADLPTWRGQTYLPGRIIFACADDLADPSKPIECAVAPLSVEPEQLRRLYPQFARSEDRSERDLSRIREAFLPPDADIPGLCRKLETLPGILWAEPRWALPVFVARPADDPYRPAQYHLTITDCETAWWWASGSAPSAVVGIIDTGVMYDHPDLAPNIWVNPGEDLNGNGFVDPSDWNGLDDDANGYIDDFWGWDWVNVGQAAVWPGEDGETPDNDPSDFDGHGTHCAGDASQRANNALGGAGVGWGVKIMALRAGYLSSSGQGLIAYYNEATVYAAENRADVISMSFGGTGFSTYTQQVLNFAYNRGVVSVAAAGNESTSQIQYPAGYQHVIAVGATNALDQMADFSNYGAWVDLFAPGEGILSTTNNGGYGNMSGTSMACPVAAGAAGLVKSLYPLLTGDEVGARLTTTCDSILTGNPYWPQALRLNVGAACDWICGVQTYDLRDADSSGRLAAGESADLIVYLQNRSPQNLSALHAELSCADPDVIILNPAADFGDLAVQQTANNAASPFSLALSSGFSGYRRAELMLHFTDNTGYDYRQALEIQLGRGEILIVNADQGQNEEVYYYYTVALDNLGRTYEIWDAARQGTPDLALLNYYPRVIWYTGTAEQDVFPTEASAALAQFLDGGGRLILSGQNIARTLHERSDPFLYDYLGAAFVDDNAGDFSVQGIAGDPISAGMNFIILGSGGAANQTSQDVVAAAGEGAAMLVYDASQPDRLAGVHCDAHGAVVFLPFGFEAVNDSATGFTTRTAFLSAMLNWLELYGIESARGQNLPEQFALHQNYPNPFNPTTVLTFDLPHPARTSLAVFDVGGRMVWNVGFGESDLRAGTHSVTFDGSDLASGIYFARLQAGEYAAVKKMVLVK